MQATNNSALNVLLKLVFQDNRKPVAKAIPYQNMTYEQLVQKAKALAAKHDMLNNEKEPVITYDAFNSSVEVEDDTDLQLALSGALQNKQSQITFNIETGKSQTSQTQKKDEDEEMKAEDEDDDLPVKGKRNKAKNAKMPRKALKHLINQELEKQSKEVFMQILKSKDLEGLLQDKEMT